MKQDFRCGGWLLEKTETAMKVITRNLDRGIWRVMIGSANQTAMAYWKPIKKKKPKSHNDLGFMFGGSVEIRTLEPFRVAGFQDRCLQPLGHASNEAHYKHLCSGCKAPIYSTALKLNKNALFD